MPEKQAMKQGTVSFYDRRKGWGKIKPAEGGDDVFVHATSIETRKGTYLVEGEPVEYDVEDTDKGPAAKSVFPLEQRIEGSVERFDTKKGFGMILAEGTDTEYFAHYTEVVSNKSFKTLEEGQEVSFVPEVESNGRYRAKRIDPDARPPLERFAILPKFDDKIDALAELAQEEDWSYHNSSTPSGGKHPILWNYIHYSFRRLKAEGKIAETVHPESGKRLACFNTNLVTKNYEPIFAAFHENNSKDADQPFVLSAFVRESQDPITLFEKRPEAANYFVKPEDLIYDRSIELVCNVDHIIDERMDRFPSHYKSKPGMLATALNIAIDRAKRRVLQNYKTAIPVFHRDRIQLLLPLCLDSPQKADVALVVAKHGRVYKGYTVLTLDMAYNNARLLTRPDREWLVP